MWQRAQSEAFVGQVLFMWDYGGWNQGYLELQDIPEQSLVVWWFKMNKGREHMVQSV